MIKVVLFLFLLFLCGCGGGSGSVYQSDINQDKYYVKDYSHINWSDTSIEYQQWQTKLPVQVSKFPDFFNLEIKKWSFDSWEKYPFNIGELFTPNRIYQEHIFNCHYITILIIGNYGGEYIYLDYWDSQDDHAFYRGYDEEGELYITTWVVDGQWQIKLFRNIEEILRKGGEKDGFQENMRSRAGG